MKGNFSFQRLKLLVEKEVAENKYIYISLLCSFSVIAIVSCLCVGFLGEKMGNDIENHQQCALLLSVFVGIFDVMLVALPAILGYTSVRRLCFDKTRCFYMLLPANNSEKIISLLLVNFIVFPIVLFLTMVCLCAFCIISFNMNPFETIYTNMLIASKSEIVCYLASMMVFAYQFFIFFPTLFRKHVLIKAIALFVFFLLLLTQYVMPMVREAFALSAEKTFLCIALLNAALSCFLFVGFCFRFCKIER